MLILEDLRKYLEFVSTSNKPYHNMLELVVDDQDDVKMSLQTVFIISLYSTILSIF